MRLNYIKKYLFSKYSMYSFFIFGSPHQFPNANSKQSFETTREKSVHYVAFRKVTDALWTIVHFLKFDGSKYVHSVAFRKTLLIFYFQHWAICNMRGFYNFLTPPLIQRRQEIARCCFHTHEITDFTACWIFVCQFKKGCLWNWTTLWPEKKI